MNVFEYIYKGDFDSVKSYIKNGGDINAIDESGYTALNMAAILKKDDIVKLLKKNGAKTDFFTEIAIGDIEAVKNYINEGVDTNSANKHGHQALMVAAHQGHIDIVKLLISRNADINAKHSFSGNTALIGATHQGHIDMVKLLIDANADLNIKNNEEKTALQIALGQGNTEIANLLKSAGAK